MSPAPRRPKKAAPGARTPLSRVFVELYEPSDVEALEAVTAAFIAKHGHMPKADVIRRLLREAHTRLQR